MTGRDVHDVESDPAAFEREVSTDLDDRTHTDIANRQLEDLAAIGRLTG